MKRKEKRTLHGVLTLMLMLGLMLIPGLLPETVCATGGNPQIVDGVYQIEDYDDLKAFAEIVNKGGNGANAELTGEIQCKDKNWVPIGTDAKPYIGCFDGDNHIIKGLSNENREGVDELYNQGLFGVIGSGGLVENVGLEGGKIKGKNCVGGLAGFNLEGKIINCRNSGAVSGSDGCVGGLAGLNGGTITSCYNTGEVSGKKDYVGGLAGNNSGEDAAITNCYNIGAVSGDSSFVGGLVGYNQKGKITKCYNSGVVSGGIYVGGVAGSNDDGETTNCYYDKTSSAVVIGVGHQQDDPAAVTGLTTSQMTGEEAIGENHMDFTYAEGEENPWLVKSNGIDKASGEYYEYYPHLKGFNLDGEGNQLSADKISPADWPAKPHIHTVGNEHVYFMPWVKTDQLPDQAGSYYLTGDVTLSGAWNVPSGTTNLCLNGYGITTGLNDSAINNSGATLNLYDCNSTQQTHYFTVDSSGLATVDDLVQAGAESFTGGYITGRTVSVDHVPDRGGGVHVLESGTFSMFGGTIIGNAAAFGGGVYIGGDAVFNLIDGSIAYNTVSGSGGGVDVGPYSMGFNMSGGSITNNTADRDAGGINLRKNCTFNMTGGSITDNTANGNWNHDGGGVWVSDQAGCNISGASKITGNKTDGADRNVYLAYGETNHKTSKINVDRALSDGAAIGITLGTTDGAGVFTTGLSGKLPDGKPASDIFFSDSTDYSVSETAGGEAQLVVRTDIASGTCSFNDATYAGKEISPQTMTLKLPDTDTRELKLDTDYKITNYKGGNDADMGTAKPKYAGTYKATVEGIGKYKGNAVVTFTIEPAPLIITAKDQTLTYNGQTQGEGDTAYEDPAEIAEKVEVKGLQGNDELTKIDVDGQGKEVGEYDLVPNDAAVGNATDNYKITYVNGTLTITQAPQPPATSIDNAPVVLDDAPLIYIGQPVTPVIKTIGGKTLQEGRDYTIRYTQGDTLIEAPTDAGTYTMTITGRGNFAGSTSTEFTIEKADGTLTATGNKVKTKSKTVKLKKAKKISADKAYTIEGAVGELAFSKVTANKAAKKFKVNATTGQIKVKKGLKKGKYELTVLISDPGDKNHEAAEAEAIVKIRIRK